MDLGIKQQLLLVNKNNGNNKRKKKGKRKNVDYQWTEYIVYSVIKNIIDNININSYSQILCSFDQSIDLGYLNDLIINFFSKDMFIISNY